MRTTRRHRSTATLAVLAAVVVVTATGCVPIGHIRTIAGTGQGCNDADLEAGCGDGGPAVDAKFVGSPNGVAYDTAGNLYIADPDARRVRKVDRNGTITNFAGTGEECPGFGFGWGPCGDGGQAVNARFVTPRMLATDLAGNVYIGDSGMHRVRKVAPDGTISRVAGSGGGGCDPTEDCGDGGPAFDASIVGPSSIAVNADGELFIGGGNQVRMVDTDGIITTVGGNGYACLVSTPTYPVCGDGGLAVDAHISNVDGLAFDIDGSVILADRSQRRVRRIEGDGTIGALAGLPGSAPCSATPPSCGDGGPATEALFDFPRTLIVDSSGNIFVGDQGANRIRKIDTDGIITTVAGTGDPCSDQFAPCGDGGPAAGAWFTPLGLAINRLGSIAVATDSWRVRLIERIAAPTLPGQTAP